MLVEMREAANFQEYFAPHSRVLDLTPAQVTRAFPRLAPFVDWEARTFAFPVEWTGNSDWPYCPIEEDGEDGDLAAYRLARALQRAGFRCTNDRGLADRWHFFPTGKTPPPVRQGYAAHSGQAQLAWQTLLNTRHLPLEQRAEALLKAMSEWDDALRERFEAAATQTAAAAGYEVRSGTGMAFGHRGAYWQGTLVYVYGDRWWTDSWVAGTRVVPGAPPLPSPYDGIWWDTSQGEVAAAQIAQRILERA